MSQVSVESSIRAYVGDIEGLRPDPLRLNAAIADATRGGQERAGSHRRRWTPLATVLACLALGAAVATAATGVLGSALDSFLGGGAAPGRQISAEGGPRWLQPKPDYNAPSEASVVASSKGEVLYAYRQGDLICFMYGTHAGDCRSPANWRQELERELWILSGPVGKSTWFGLVTTGISSVKVEYADGDVAEVPVSNDGFVAVLDPARDPRRIVGLDSNGEAVVSRSLDAEGP